MQDRFREMTTSGDKFAARRNMFRAVVADNFGSPTISSRKEQPVEGDAIMQAHDDGLAAIEQFEKVWKMPDEEDETEVDLSSAIPGTLESFGPSKTNSFNERDVASDSSRSLGLRNENLAVDEESLTERSAITEFSEPDDPNAVVKKRDLRDLNKMIKLDDFKALETKAELLAQSFKQKLAGTGLISDGTPAKNTRKESSPPRPLSVAQEASDHGSSNKIDSVEIFLVESTGESSGPPLEIDYPNRDSSRVNSLDEASVGSSGQKAGEPSRGDGCEADNSGTNAPAPGNTTESSKGALSQGSNGFLSPGDSSRKAGVSFKSDTLFKDAGPSSYNIGEWSAVGGLNTVLTDFSDTSSFSSATSSAFSVSSMEATTRASSLETPFANELDTLVAKKDWDGVQLAAKTYESTSPQENNQAASIDEIKKKKRELEASWRHSVSRSYGSEQNESNGNE